MPHLAARLCRSILITATLTVLGCGPPAEKDPTAHLPERREVTGLAVLQVDPEAILIRQEDSARTQGWLLESPGGVSAESVIYPGEAFTLTDAATWRLRYTLVRLQKEYAVLLEEAQLDRRGDWSDQRSSAEGTGSRVRNRIFRVKSYGGPKRAPDAPAAESLFEPAPERAENP